MQSWTVLQYIGPVRRTMHNVRKQCMSLYKFVFFWAWAAVRHADFRCSQNLPRTHVSHTDAEFNNRQHSAELPRLGWGAIVRRVSMVSRWYSWRRIEAMAFHTIVILQRLMAESLRADRTAYYESLALCADRAAANNDMHGIFTVLREVSGRKRRPPQSIQTPEGVLTVSEAQRCSTWQNHFCKVAGGYITNDFHDMITSSTQPVLQTSLSIGPERLLKSIFKLNPRKALGNDLIGADLLRAGGFPLAVRLNDLSQRICDKEQMPVRWKGGRQKELFKSKGSPTNTDDYRGLLISDHMAKAFLGVLKDEVDPVYQANQPRSQHGAMKGRGTDSAHHFVLSCLDYAVISAMSIMVLFVDLSKAYDRILREIVMGYPQHVPNQPDTQLKYLMKLGLEENVAKFIYEYIAEFGDAFFQWSLDRKVASLINALHSKCWFQYDGCSDYAVTLTGGRQGCIMGGLVFNAGFGLAISFLKQRLREHGIILKIHRCNGPFWASCPQQGDPDEEILEVIFVDDTTFVLMAPSPSKLWSSMHILLENLVHVFTQFGLHINWKPGKTETLLLFRGKNATEFMERVKKEDGSCYIEVPNTCQRLHVVTHYKHLGSVVQGCNSNYLEARLRARNAMEAYVPLCIKIFGNESYSFNLKELFGRSLVLSRLLFHTHLRVFTGRELKIINAAYMRLVRRLADKVRFESGSGTDIAARMSIAWPSIDCLIMRQRLTYLARLVCGDSTALLAILQQEVLHSRSATKRRLPWVAQSINDMRVLYISVVSARVCLPPPDDAPQVWWSFIREQPEKFKEMVKDLFFCESVCDTRVEATDTDVVTRFACNECGGRSFSTSKALKAHQRAKHGARNHLRYYCSDSGQCLACHKTFSTRWRLLAHLSDDRRPGCRDWVLAFGVKMSEDEVQRLDASDRVQRQVARKCGHTQPLSKARVFPHA